MSERRRQLANRSSDSLCRSSSKSNKYNKNQNCRRRRASALPCVRELHFMMSCCCCCCHNLLLFIMNCFACVFAFSYLFTPLCLVSVVSFQFCFPFSLLFLFSVCSSIVVSRESRRSRFVYVSLGFRLCGISDKMWNHIAIRQRLNEISANEKPQAGRDREEERFLNKVCFVEYPAAISKSTDSKHTHGLSIVCMATIDSIVYRNANFRPISSLTA